MTKNIQGLKRNQRPRPTRDDNPEPGRPVYRKVPIEHLLEPLDPDRETFDEVKLDELEANIRWQGLLEPLLGIQEGPNVRITAGHRRFLCCKRLGYRSVDCMVWPEGTTTGEAMMAAENAFREDLNPAEEARKFKRLLDGVCGGDTDRLCELRGMTRVYVEGRLLLLEGDARVLEALAKSEITYGVAQWLNKCKDPMRRLSLLMTAVESGASVRSVRDWVQQGNAFDEYQAHPDGKPVDYAPPSGAAVIKPLLCEYCQLGPQDGAIELIYAHRHCHKAVIRAFEEKISRQE